MNGDKMVVVVASGYQTSDSVEFLLLDETSQQKWISGKAHIHIASKGLAIWVTYILGPSLPLNIPEVYSVHSHLVSNKDNMYYIDTFFNHILQLKCQSDDLLQCQWIEMEHKLQYPRGDAIVSFIPDSMVDCSWW